MAIISETAATLRFRGDDLEPLEISRLLGVDGEGCRKGDRQFTPNGKEMARARSGGWKLGTERAVPGDLDGQISTLLDGLTEDLDVWQDLSLRYRGEIFVGLFMIQDNEGIGISAASLQKLAERGLKIDFDVYRPLRVD